MDCILKDIPCPCSYHKRSPTLSTLAHHHEVLETVESLATNSATTTTTTVSNHDLYFIIGGGNTFTMQLQLGSLYYMYAIQF